MKCRECGAQVSPGDEFCPECGADLPANEGSERNRCRVCGGELAPDDAICPECSAAVDQVATDEDE